MNKKLKKIIGLTLACSAIMGVQPSKYMCARNSVYASEKLGLKEVKLCQGDTNNELKLYSDQDYKQITSFDENITEYYAKTKSNSVNFNFKAPKGYIVKIFKSDSSVATAYNSGEKMILGSGVTSIYVRIYKKSEFDIDDVDSSYEKEYEIHLNRENTMKKDNNQDDIYLKDISLSDGEIDFDKEVTCYDIALEASQGDIEIKAKPEEDDDYRVRIDRGTVEYEDNYEKEVHVRIGKTPIKIELKDDNDNKRVYTLNFLRGDNLEAENDEFDSENCVKNSENVNVNENTQSNSSTSFKNQWAEENNKWKYYDVSGSAIKNTWFTDVATGRQYYFYADGSMATGWILYNNNWYYLGLDGAMRIGWQYINNSWYFFGSLGEMVSNTVINGYSIGIDGRML